MSIDLQGTDLSKFILVGDRILIKPKSSPNKTRSGLYLPPGVHENEKIHSGYVIKVGPGYPVAGNLDDEPWKANTENLNTFLYNLLKGILLYIFRKPGLKYSITKKNML